MVQGGTEAVLTNLDVLGYLKEIPVCTAYEIDGEVTGQFPTTPRLMRAKPVYTTLPGWECDVRGIKNYDDLPANCKAYVSFLEKQVGAPIRMVSNGPRREEILYREV
jgi:adenylosuccinate synthase